MATSLVGRGKKTTLNQVEYTPKTTSVVGQRLNYIRFAVNHRYRVRSLRTRGIKQQMVIQSENKN